jgi:hypothetical protein
MEIVDIVWMALILGGTGYLLYRSVWRKQGCCQGCGNGSCPKRM